MDSQIVYYSFARHRPFTLEHTSLEYAARSRHRTAHGQIPLEPAGKQQRFVRSLLPKLEAVGAPRVVARRAQHSPMVVSEHPETIRLAGKHRVAKLASACVHQGTETQLGVLGSLLKGQAMS